MRKWVKLAAAIAAGLLFVAMAYVAGTVWRFERSLAKVHEIPLPALAASNDPAAIERGRHLSVTVGGCASGDCHGSDLGGGDGIVAGPVGTFFGPNLTPGSFAASASDGELARLLLHGVKRDGRTVRMMPVHEINWLPDEDVVALLSFLRSVPAVAKPDGKTTVGLLGKMLDRHDLFVIDIARRIDHTKRETAPAPAPTALYGAYLARVCMGCHGEGYSGGKIPGAPAELPIPTNLTPHPTGLAAWTFADFERMGATGLRPDGTKLHPMMPVAAIDAMNETEKRALWEFLRSLPAKPFGGR